jgi:hypothetical protein
MHKYIILGLMLFSLSCQKDESYKLFDCLSTKTDELLKKEEVLKYIYGTWQLRQMITMIPQDTVPDIKVTFKDVLGAPIDKQIADISLDGKLIGSILYTLVEKTIEGKSYVYFESDSYVIGNTNEYNFIRGDIRICPDELRIDNGMAFDAPAYLFQKI